MKNIIKTLENHYNKLPANVRHKVILYSNDGYKKVNDYLFAPAFHSKDKSRVKEYTNAIDKSFFELPFSLVVYKGLSMRFQLYDRLKKLKINEVYQFKAYISTSLDKDIAKTFGTVIKINIPKGTKVIYIPNPLNQEKEILIQRNLKLKKVSNNEFSIIQ